MERVLIGYEGRAPGEINVFRVAQEIKDVGIIFTNLQIDTDTNGQVYLILESNEYYLTIKDQLELLISIHEPIPIPMTAVTFDNLQQKVVDTEAENVRLKLEIDNLSKKMVEDKVISDEVNASYDVVLQEILFEIIPDLQSQILS